MASTAQTSAISGCCGSSYFPAAVVAPAKQLSRQPLAKPCSAASAVSRSSPLASSWLGASFALKSRVSSKSATLVCLAATGKTAKVGELYEVTLNKPIGIAFSRGSDGATYVRDIESDSLAEEEGVQVGDKVLATSAVFGDEMWPAAEYGRVLYTLKTRIGSIRFEMERTDGSVEMNYTRSQFERERAGGNYGVGTKELQWKNYEELQQKDKQRLECMEAGLKLYKQGKYDEALIQFESILGLTPLIREEQVAAYNAACCYSKMGNVDAGLELLSAALKAGFDDYKAVRNDADLATLRTSESFAPLINQYDEPLINENAIKAFKGLFGGFGKK
eukprot:jgi/Mesvir1/24453/Mv21822-RA.1